MTHQTMTTTTTTRRQVGLPQTSHKAAKGRQLHKTGRLPVLPGHGWLLTRLLDIGPGLDGQGRLHVTTRGPLARHVEDAARHLHNHRQAGSRSSNRRGLYASDQGDVACLSKAAVCASRWLGGDSRPSCDLPPRAGWSSNSCRQADRQADKQTDRQVERTGSGQEWAG